MYANHQVDALFPLYAERASMEDCLFSQAYRTTVLSFAEPVAAPLRWTTVNDLARYRLGVVRGYLNTPLFDQLAAEKILWVEQAASDEINLRKVAAGRIDAAVIDTAVFSYLMATEPHLQGIGQRLRLSPRPLGNRTLHVCFHNTERGAQLKGIFERFVNALPSPPQAPHAMPSPP